MHHNPPRRRSCLPYLNKIHNQINRKSRIRLYILRGGRQKGDHLWIQRKSGIMFSWGLALLSYLPYLNKIHNQNDRKLKIRLHILRGRHTVDRLWIEMKSGITFFMGVVLLPITRLRHWQVEALAIYQGLVPLENRGIKQMRHGRFYVIIHHMHCRQHIHLARPIHR